MDLRIVLLGNQGAGKSSAVNTLLGRKPFNTEASSKGVTKYCFMSTCIVDGHRISVLDTPGWTDYSLMEDETIVEIASCVDLLDPGPHVFLLVYPIGRFTKEEINRAQQFLGYIGEEASKYTMVLFTKGDDLEEKTIEEYLESVHPDLKKILEVCGGRYHVFNNRDKRNHKQVPDLLEKIKLMVERNEGKYYTKVCKNSDMEKRIEKSYLQEDEQESTAVLNDQERNEEDMYMVHTAKFHSEKAQSGKFHGENSCAKKSQSRRESHNKELHIMELKWQKREAELQKSIERKNMTWLKEKRGLEKEIQQLEIKLQEKKAEVEKVKRQLQQQQIRTDTQRKEIERLKCENDENMEKMKQRSTALQRHCDAFERMINMNKQTDTKTLQTFLSQLKKDIFHP